MIDLGHWAAEDYRVPSAEPSTAGPEEGSGQDVEGN